MFRSFITLATLLATGAHSLIGCCWHHDHGQHAVRDAEQTAPEHKAADEHACDCQPDCESPSQPNTDAISTIALCGACPCGDSQHNDSDPFDPCDGGQCQYLANAKVEPPSWDDASQLVSSAVLPVAKPAELLHADGNGTGTLHRAAFLRIGSLCVRDVTQVALI